MTNRRFGTITLALGAFLAVAAAPARATTLTFDNVPPSFVDQTTGQLLDGYAGLNWYDFFIHEIVPGNPAAYGDVDSLSQASTVDPSIAFDFTSAYLTAVPPPNGAVSQFWMRVTGSNLGGTNEVKSALIFLDADAPQTWVFDGFLGLDTLTFAALESDQNTPCFECYFGIDDLTLNETPEPASLVLLGTGILALLGAARRRQTPS